MPKRYSISSTKQNQGPSKLDKQSSEKLHVGEGVLSGKLILVIGVAALILTNLATFGVTYFVMNSRINALAEEKAKLSEELGRYQQAFERPSSAANSQTKNDNSPKTGIQIPQNTSDAVKKATESRSPSDITPVLASDVTVAVAGSSSTTQPAAQAANSLSFLLEALAPWNWNLSQDQLNELRAGQYARYFGDNAVVGISSNGYVVSYMVNESGEVTSIFISPSFEDAVGGQGSE